MLFLTVNLFFLFIFAYYHSEIFKRFINYLLLEVAYFVVDKLLLIKVYISEYINPIFSQVKDKFFCYNLDGNLLSINNYDNNNDFLYIHKKINDKEYFILNGLNDYFDNKVHHIFLFKTQPFIQMTLYANGKMYDINNEIKKFYIKYHFFDKVFFKAFMKYFYSVEIDENNYTIEVITKDCDIININCDNVLFLSNKEITEQIIKNRNYEIINDYKDDNFCIN